MAMPRMMSCLAAGGVLLAASFLIAAPSSAQPPPAPPPPPPAILSARIVVTGEGSVTVTPDYAEITGGVTTRANTASEAVAENSRRMNAVDAALRSAGIAQNDIQTARFSVAPFYTSPPAGRAPKLAGFSVTNDVRVKVRPIGKVGNILDALIAAGATDAGSVQFLHSDTSKSLDRARQAAIADARRKAEVYAQAAGLTLGGVAWITEESAAAPPTPFLAMRTLAAAPPVPIAPGEDTLRVNITVGFQVAH